MVLSWILLRGLNYFARKATPIAAMLQVSMIFPDEAPSRARTALRSTNGKKILREFREAEAAGLNAPSVPSSDFLAGMLRALAEHEVRPCTCARSVRQMCPLQARSFAWIRNIRRSRPGMPAGFRQICSVQPCRPAGSRQMCQSEPGKPAG